MKTKRISFFLSVIFILSACQAPLPTVEAKVNNEFTLAPGQSVSVKRADLTITFNSVLSDERCPSQIDCASSGPVTVSLSVQKGSDTPSTITLETFTDQDGRAPMGPFEGIQDRIDLNGYLLQITGILPYPKNLSGIKASDYQVSLIVLGD